MSDGGMRYNLLKPSCFTPSVANSSNNSSTMYALGADGWVCGAGNDHRGWGAKAAEWAVELPAGAYALLYEVDGKQGEVWDDLQVYVGEDIVGRFSHHDGPYSSAMSIKLNAESNVSIMVKCYAPARYRLMLVEGDTPAAWAPAEGEELAGGVALMSANLLDGATVMRGTKDSDGYWVFSKNDGTDKQDSPLWRIDGQPTLEENQTMHLACSVMPDEDWTSDACRMSIQYADAAGNLNWADHHMGAAKAGVWTRLETSVVVPSGMRVTGALASNAYSHAAGAKVTGVMVSYGSPVTLASSAHTPYATQDHLQTNYATNSALEQTSTEIQASVSDSLTQAKTYTDDSVSTEVTNRNAAITAKADEITSAVSETYATKDALTEANTAITQNTNAISSEVTAREATDGNVSTLSTKVTQIADSITTEISDRKAAISDLQSSSLSTVAVYYALSTSSTTAPTDSWSTTAPAWTNGEYMWQKTVTTKADGTTVTSDPTCISGATGATGAKGTGVSSIKPQYYLSTSSTTQNGGSWSDTCPAWVTGKYYWTRNYVTWSDGTTTTTIPVLDDASNTANQAAADALSSASNLSTLIRESSDGIDVGKSSEGNTYSTAVARVGSDGAFHVLSSALTELASYGASLIELGKNSASSVIKFCGDMLRLQYKSGDNLFEIAANYGNADTHQNISMSFYNNQSNDYDGRGMGLDFIPAGVNGLTKSEMSAWILCDAFQVNTEKWRIGAYEIPEESVAKGLHGLDTVRRSAGILTGIISTTEHYTKIGTWSGTDAGNALKLRVMTGNGADGRPDQNSEIDIHIKDAWQSSNSTTSAYGVAYELHNASSAVLSAYVVATAYNSCEVWIKNSWYDESGWYVAEYDGGTWSDGGSLHQTGTPSGTAQNTACTGAAVYSGTKVVYTTNSEFQLFSGAEVNAIIGHSIHGATDTVAVCSGDDKAYRGIMTASIQDDANIVVKCNPTPGGWIQVNYIIATS